MNTQFCIFYLNRQAQTKADPRSPGVILRHRKKTIFRDKKTRKVENYIQERILSKNYVNLTRLLKVIPAASLSLVIALKLKTNPLSFDAISALKRSLKSLFASWLQLVILQVAVVKCSLFYTPHLFL